MPVLLSAQPLSFSPCLLGPWSQKPWSSARIAFPLLPRQWVLTRKRHSGCNHPVLPRSWPVFENHFSSATCQVYQAKNSVKWGHWQDAQGRVQSQSPAGQRESRPSNVNQSAQAGGEGSGEACRIRDLGSHLRPVLWGCFWGHLRLKMDRRGTPQGVRGFWDSLPVGPMLLPQGVVCVASCLCLIGEAWGEREMPGPHLWVTAVLGIYCGLAHPWGENSCLSREKSWCLSAFTSVECSLLFYTLTVPSSLLWPDNIPCRRFTSASINLWDSVLFCCELCFLL